MMKKNKFKISLTILVLILCCIAAQALPKDLLTTFRRGSIEDITDACGKAINEEHSTEDLAKIYTILAFSYILSDSDDAVDRCSGLLELLPEHSDLTPAVSLIKILASEGSPKNLDINKFPTDWQAAADITLYLNALRKKDAAPEELYAYFKDYNRKVSKLEKTSWIKTFKGRFSKWQVWIQNGKGEKERLPALVAKIEPGSKQVVITETKTPPVPVDEEKIYTGINQILQDYLAGDTKGAVQKAAELKKITPEKSGLSEIVAYLSSPDKNDTDKLMNSGKMKASEWALASIAMFVKYLATLQGAPDKYKLYFYLDNFDGNIKLVKNNSAVSAWGPFSKKWRKWIDNGFKNDGSGILEHLLVSHSGMKNASADNAGSTQNETPSRNITEITEEDFIAERGEKYSSRPRPESLEFDDDDIEKELEAYLNSLPSSLASKERRRLKGVKKVKHYIIRIMERTPYPEGIIVKNKKKPGKTRKIKGVVYLANKHHLRIKKSKRSKRGRNYNWEDLAMEQYERFIDFFAERRLKMTGAAESKESERTADAANDYIALALLLDWYGYYADALKYAKKAVEIKPEFSDKVSDLLLD
jgi:tetratricopeptide (TPR) repeat protein